MTPSDCILDAWTSAGVPFVRVRAPGYSVAKTFDCGQTFRFSPVGGDPAYVEGTACEESARETRITVDGREPGVLILGGVTPETFAARWYGYLALDEDCEEAERAILASVPLACPVGTEAALRETADALAAGRGIHILRQEPWETLVTFILSQNNNIPRIRGIVARLVRACGRFPTPEDLFRIGADGLYALGCGFRAKYLADAAGRVLDGEVSLARIAGTMDYDAAQAELMTIRGVGPKVASCVLLFGFHRTEAFPVDVWMKKSLARRYPGGLDPAPFGRWAGYLQQCLFFSERNQAALGGASEHTFGKDVLSAR